MGNSDTGEVLGGEHQERIGMGVNRALSSRADPELLKETQILWRGTYTNHLRSLWRPERHTFLNGGVVMPKTSEAFEAQSKR